MRSWFFFALSSLAVSATAQSHKTVGSHAIGAAQTTPDADTVFSFMGDDTETPTTRTALNGSKCTTSQTEMSCNDYSNPEIAGRPLKFLVMKFSNGKLYEVLGAMGNFAYDDIFDAFKEKYGTPKIETRKWQSKGGATFDNLVATWDFKGGQLELDSMGADVNSSDFVFISTANSPPKAPPKIDF